MSLLLLTFMIFVSTSTSQQPSLHLHSHIWCPPCKKAEHILNKVAQNYPKVKFEIHSYNNKTILRKANTSLSSANVLPFPTLVFNCSGQTRIYQNDLTAAEVSYWIDVLCLEKIPICTNDINEQLFHISVLPQHNQSALRREIENYPHIKVCSAKNANYTQAEAIKILQKTVKSTLFLDYFNQNVRNYLIKSKKLAVALITNNVNTTKAASFFTSYLSLENFMDDEKVTNLSSIFNYKIKDQHKSKLMFLGLCYNSNLSKCVSQSERHPQVASSQKNIPKLLDFLNLQTDQVSQVEYVVAFRFNYPKFESYVYHALGILDEKFIFWISQLLQGNNKRLEEKHRCLWNSLTHRISQNSLEDIQAHAFLTKNIDELKLKFSEELSLTKIVRLFHNDPKLTLCLTGQMPQSFDSNQQLQKILKKILAHFSEVKQQSSDYEL